MTRKQSLGSPVVTVFGDHLDPSTRAAIAAVREAGGEVEFRHLPKRSGLAAAIAAEAARELGALDAMHDALLRHDGPLDSGHLRAYAQSAGLDPAQFEQSFGSDAQMARIREDLAAAGTDLPPALFLDGERLPSYEPGWLRERFSR